MNRYLVVLFAGILACGCTTLRVADFECRRARLDTTASRSALGSDPCLSGRHIANATITGNGQDAKLVVNLNDNGRHVLSRLTREIGKHEYVAVLLGGEPVPVDAVRSHPPEGTITVRLGKLRDNQIRRAEVLADIYSRNSRMNADHQACGLQPFLY